MPNKRIVSLLALALVMAVGCSGGGDYIDGDVFSDVGPDGITADGILPGDVSDELPDVKWPFDIDDDYIFIDDDDIPEDPFDPFRITGISDILGTASVGETLTAGDLIPSGATADFQWLRGKEVAGLYELIEGATDPSYDVTEKDGARYLRVRVTGTGDYFGLAQSKPTARIRSTNTS